ncbi:uncharacterized protein J3R85_016190 [Psidium guajava]|nr:uncharacterized protein J3R85_016190 [Psidium guajava]
MGFLHKLWDETLAGPAPDSGLGELRRHGSFSAARSSAAHHPAPPPIPDSLAVTRSITIVRTTPALRRSVSLDPGSGPSTPGTPLTRTSAGKPKTRLSGTPDGKLKRFTKRKPPTEGSVGAQPRGPTDYDWIVISALDR